MKIYVIFDTDGGVHATSSEPQNPPWVELDSADPRLTFLPALTTGQLQSYLSAKWDSVIAGGTVSAAGFRTSTAERWQGYVSRAAQGAALNPTVPILWNGVAPITAAQLDALQAAAQAFVQDAFAIEGAAAAAIVAGTITETAEIDALAWPVSS